MTDPNYTALLIILDRSGSMEMIKDDMVGGLRALLRDQQELPGLVTVDVVQFDSNVETTHQFADPATLELSIEPRGRTALHDAIGIGISSFAARLDGLPTHAAPGTIQVIVVTDGHENASVEYSSTQVRELIEAKQADSRWDFVFLGANQDAVVTGGQLGFRADSSMTFAARGPEVSYSSEAASRYIRDRRQGNRQGFSSEERHRSEGGERS